MLMTRSNKQWKDFSTGQKLSIVALGIVQFSLLITALVDIRRRPAEQINGSKRMWTALAFVNYVGPLAYFAFGRKR